MAISQGLLFWLLINLENNVHFQPSKHWKRSVETSYSETCPNEMIRDFNSFLWVMDRNPPVYFFGTIHVPYTKVWDRIPSNSKHALRNAKNVYFELDLTDQEYLRALERCKTLENGVKLRDVLPSTLYKRIKSHLSYIRGKISKWITVEQRFMGISPLRLYQQLTKNWHKKRPIWMMLLLDKLTEYDVKLLAQGLPVLDMYLQQETLSNRKTMGSIETVEEQCEVLNKLNESQVIMALNQTLILQEKIRRGEEKQLFSTKEMIYHYNCGDLKNVLFSQDISSIANLENTSEPNSLQRQKTTKFEEYMKEELFFKRNRKMANRIAKLVNEEPRRRLLFALGAGHFLGNKSIISILRSKGYNITHLKASDPLPRYGRNKKKKKVDCKSRKQRKGGRNRKGGKKQRRRRNRNRKSCNIRGRIGDSDIYPTSKKREMIKPTRKIFKSSTTQPTHDPAVVAAYESGLPSSTSKPGGQWSWIVIWVISLCVMNV